MSFNGVSSVPATYKFCCNGNFLKVLFADKSLPKWLNLVRVCDATIDCELTLVQFSGVNIKLRELYSLTLVIPTFAGITSFSR